MPIDLVITDFCVRFTVQGAIGPAEIEDAYERAWAHPDFRLGMPYFADLRDGTIVQLEERDRRNIISFIERHLDQHGQVKTAFVCGRPVDHGIVRVIAAYADFAADLPVRVYRSEEEAFAWLRGEIE